MTLPLITSLEQAGEGSRELDEQIHDLLCAYKFRTCINGLSDEDGGLWMYEFPGHAASSALRVTTSIDAALALAERQGLDGWNTLYAAMMNWKAHDPRGPLSQTLPLALCLAILKATNPKGQPNV